MHIHENNPDNLNIKLPNEFFNIHPAVHMDQHYYTPEDTDYIQSLFTTDVNPLIEDCDIIVFVSETARLVGFINPKYYPKNTAYFGYFESTSNMVNAKKVFFEFEEWCKNHNINRILGPINFSTAHQFRIQTSGFTLPSFQNEPTNPEYYKKFFLSIGFSTIDTYYTDHIDIHSIEIPTLTNKNAAAKKPYSIHLIDNDEFKQKFDMFYAFFLSSFQTKTGVISLPASMAWPLWGEPLARLLCPNTSHVAINTKNDIIGCHIIIPDYGELLRFGHHNRCTYSELSYDTHFKYLRSPRALMKTMAIHPNYRLSNLTIDMGNFAFDHIKIHYTEAVGAMINAKASRQFGAEGHRKHLKTYELFGKSI